MVMACWHLSALPGAAALLRRMRWRSEMPAMQLLAAADACQQLHERLRRAAWRLSSGASAWRRPRAAAGRGVPGGHAAIALEARRPTHAWLLDDAQHDKCTAHATAAL